MSTTTVAIIMLITTAVDGIFIYSLTMIALCLFYSHGMRDFNGDTTSTMSFWSLVAAFSFAIGCAIPRAIELGIFG